MFSLLFLFAYSRDLRTLHVSDRSDGDCFTSSCSFDVASRIIRNGDTLLFHDSKISITSYPSPLSDLLHISMFMNVTFITTDKTIIDGSFIAGESLFNIHSASRFCWAKIVGFTFTNFAKPILIRIISETPWPLIIFKDCVFENNKGDIFDVKGGTFQIDNCIFRNNLHRPIKAITEAIIDVSDTSFENSESSFFSDCDAIFKNCVFTNNFGNRGGAIYASKATLSIIGSKFIRNRAKTHGGAIYVRDISPDFESEIRHSCFINNTSGVNGSSFYSYWSSLDIRESCFSETNFSIFEFRSHINKTLNKFSSKCIKCLQYVEETDEYDPIQPNPEYDIDVEVEPNSWIEL